jgi:subtilase family serine protease
MRMRRWASRSIIGWCLRGGLALLAPAALAAAPRGAVTRVGPAPAGQRLQLVLPLKADEAGLQRLAAAVSTVGSPQYGHYESLATLARRFGASAATRGRVLGYLHHAGATGAKVDATGLFASASMSVSSAQRLFATTLAQFHSARAGRYVAPTAAARVPTQLRGSVTGVVGLDTKPVFGSHQTMVAHGRFTSHAVSGYSPRTGTPLGCPEATGADGGSAQGFTPNQYLTAYGYGPLQAAGVQGQGERVALIEIDGFRYSDLRKFAACYGLAVPAINAYGVGLSKPLKAGGETTLDLEVLDAAAPRLKEVDVYESHSRAADVLRSLTAPLQNHGKTPEVISASLGTCEPALLESIGFAGVKAAEGALATAAAAGISVLASSGDAGSTACIGRQGPVAALADSFPASSPFVTGVGGTNVRLDANNSIVQQVVWNDGPADLAAGGGGRSTLFRRPSYQKGFVIVNRRIVPDVSLLADVLPGYEIYCSATPDCLGSGRSNPWVAVGGTSAAAPLFAGGLALVDQVLRARGRQQLGLANSLLYKVARADPTSGVFSDVTTGNNDLSPFLPGTHQSLGCCNAGVGFDYASGLGSPNLGTLANLAATLQPALASVGVSLPGQRPLARRHLLARLSCSRACLVGAYADIAIGTARPFKVRSASYVLRHRGRKRVKLGLSGNDVRRIRAGLRSHTKVYAFVRGVIVDSGGNVEVTSAAQRLRIRG